MRDSVLPKAGAKITQAALADALDLSRFTVNQIITGHRRITADVALRLARVLGTTPDLWLDMQKRVDLFKALKKLEVEAPKLTILRSSVGGSQSADRPDRARAL